MTDSIPTFSIFSAISEIFVTIFVIYAIVVALRGGPFHRVLLGATLLFELCVNVVYMASRAAHADTSSTLTAGMKLFYAGHGILSLLMFVGLVVVYLVSLVDESKGRAVWFRRHPGLTYVFLFFWMVSVVSGEAIFVKTYLTASPIAA
jgi:hypothetical protein